MSFWFTACKNVSLGHMSTCYYGVYGEDVLCGMRLCHSCTSSCFGCLHAWCFSNQTDTSLDTPNLGQISEFMTSAISSKSRADNQTGYTHMSEWPSGIKNFMASDMYVRSHTRLSLDGYYIWSISMCHSCLNQSHHPLLFFHVFLQLTSVFVSTLLSSVAQDPKGTQEVGNMSLLLQRQNLKKAWMSNRLTQGDMHTCANYIIILRTFRRRLGPGFAIPVMQVEAHSVSCVLVFSSPQVVAAT